MNKSLFCDIDGVVREMSQTVVEERLGIKNHMPKTWFWDYKGRDIFDLVAEDFTILSRCRTTKYYPIIYKFAQRNDITFLSCQPEEWRTYTTAWIKKYFGSHYAKKNLMYFPTSKSKLEYFEGVIQSGVDGYLIEDYPFKGLPEYVMNRIILISYPYNREVSGYHHKVTNPKQLEKVLKDYNKGNKEIL